jgi:hypothetical protein
MGVYDNAGELLGFVEENRTVRVLEEGVGLGGEHSRIELNVPSRLVGYMRSKRLGVLARRDIPIQSGLSWWLKGTRFVVLAGNRGRAQVVRAPRNHDRAAGPPGDVPCSSRGRGKVALPDEIDNTLRRTGGNAADGGVD